MAKYIKVTPKGSNLFYIIPLANKNFYLAQGAKVEEPTQEEIYKAYPEEKPAQRLVTISEEEWEKLKQEHKELEELRRECAALKKKASAKVAKTTT